MVAHEIGLYHLRLDFFLHAGVWRIVSEDSFLACKIVDRVLSLPSPPFIQNFSELENFSEAVGRMMYIVFHRFNNILEERKVLFP